jgi:hypothetical protein
MNRLKKIFNIKVQLKVVLINYIPIIIIIIIYSMELVKILQNHKLINIRSKCQINQINNLYKRETVL